MLFLEKPKLECFLPIPFSSIEKVCNLKCLKSKKRYANKTKGSKTIICSSFAKKWEEFSSLKCSLHTLQGTRKCFLTPHQNMAYMNTSMIGFVVISDTYDYIKQYELIIYPLQWLYFVVGHKFYS
jgi:hypothetical protein